MQSNREKINHTMAILNGDDVGLKLILVLSASTFVTIYLQPSV